MNWKILKRLIVSQWSPLSQTKKLVVNIVTHSMANLFLIENNQDSSSITNYRRSIGKKSTTTPMDSKPTKPKKFMLQPLIPLEIPNTFKEPPMIIIPMERKIPIIDPIPLPPPKEPF